MAETVKERSLDQKVDSLLIMVIELTKVMADVAASQEEIIEKIHNITLGESGFNVYGVD